MDKPGRRGQALVGNEVGIWCATAADRSQAVEYERCAGSRVRDSAWDHQLVVDSGAGASDGTDNKRLPMGGTTAPLNLYVRRLH